MIVLIIYAEKPHFLRYLLDFKLDVEKNTNEEVIYHAILDLKYKFEDYSDIIDKCYYLENYFQNLATTATTLINQYHYDRIVGVGEQMKYSCQQLKEYGNIHKNKINQMKFTNKFHMKEAIRKELDYLRTKHGQETMKNSFFLPVYQIIHSKLDVIDFLTKLETLDSSSVTVDSPTSSSWEDHQIDTLVGGRSTSAAIVMSEIKQRSKAVIKPVALSGCRGVQIISSIEEVDFDAIVFDGTYLIEQFVEGEMYHIDGIYHQGQIIAYPSRYLRPCAETDFSHPDMSYLIDSTSSIRTALDDFTTDFFNIFLQEEKNNYRDKEISFVFHLECFHSKLLQEEARTNNNNSSRGRDGEKGKKFYFCEIASRTGGNNINRNWINSFGIDLLKIEILMELGAFDLTRDIPHLSLPLMPSKLSGSFAIHAKTGRLTRQPRALSSPHGSFPSDRIADSQAELLYDWNYLEGEALLSHSSDGFKNRLVYGVIHSARSENELLDLFDCFQQTFYSDIEIND